MAESEDIHTGDAGGTEGGDPVTSANDIPVETHDTTIGFSREAAAQLGAIDADISAAEHEAIAALPSGSALLIVRRGPNTGARFLLDSDVTTVGRHPDAEIFLDDVTVSRKHAEIERGERGYRIRDLGSLNGTYVDRVRVDAVDLRNGDEIQVGKYRFRFVFA